MGKSFANFMCKKRFPSCIKIQHKEGGTDAGLPEGAGHIQQQVNLRGAAHSTHILLMGDDRVKSGLNFMYEAPPGASKGDKLAIKSFIGD
ncbi:corepressor interacting with RBPJ 1-like [Sinocyclocheilus anshuiensis]|uniref:corepressor interacting with RBPJ 1-like n=1 Tax=Sinocyclocheilus anshuiensis TaxID=1608454 RepID=UPI0007B913C4|nr:PREDICTED: corepressor interacting with RBPJ 1-like [Sinocyclocheilus anshuiensis]